MPRKKKLGFVPKTPAGEGSRAPAFVGKPQVGQVLLLFSTGVRGWQHRVGSGWHTLLVTKVGREMVHLFQVAHLVDIEMPWKTELPHYRPRVHDTPDPEYLSKALDRAVSIYTTHHKRFSSAAVERARRAIDLIYAKGPDASGT